jgi:hypothetical protein
MKYMARLSRVMGAALNRFKRHQIRFLVEFSPQLPLFHVQCHFYDEFLFEHVR